ncbi:Crp/Fnr family transcriptional regulator [Brevundimonas faecalis]|uniref:CRP-like cAMP-binding protein n=1 Tax=Brevundimonas faecalis TaxID=947378 RepID=A0ABV2REX9_9CAUL
MPAQAAVEALPVRLRIVPRRRCDVRDHPVYLALPPAAQRSLLQTGAPVDLLAAEEVSLEGDYLWFVLSGVLGLFPQSSTVCVSHIPSGSVHGWRHALGSSCGDTEARPLVDVRLFRVPAHTVRTALGHDWLSRFVAFQTMQRLTQLESEAACNASHRVNERLAKWLVRLEGGANGAPLKLTQARLGAMLGVQRTSINAAAQELQEAGLIRFGRGRVEVLDLPGLATASCGCGA